MKKTHIVVFIMIFLFTGALSAFAADMGEGSSEINQMRPLSGVGLATASGEISEYYDETQSNEAEALAFEQRVEEIRNMDIDGLDSAEKKDLRDELRNTKEELQSRGIYIGAGTLILIVLLIILLVD